MQNKLYISHSRRGSKHFYLDASARYRCIFPCYECSPDKICHSINFEQLEQVDLKHYNEIIFHRPRFTPKLKEILDSLSATNIKLIADFDDLLFSPEHAYENPTYLTGNTSKKASGKATHTYLNALKLFDHVQVSTDRLKEHVNRLHPAAQVFVKYNQLPDFWPKLAETFSAAERLEKKVIRYFPGTTHHTNNFNQTINFLVEYLHKNKDVTLEVIGDIKIDKKLFSPNQFKQFESTLFDELPNLIASSWVTISPLEDNEFNRCKSGLKFWESGIFGVPVISNNNLDMMRFMNKGLLLSDNAIEWESYLDTLKNLNNYQLASEEATLASQKAYITNGHLCIDSDLKLLSTILCANVGPNWLESLFNPANNTHLKTRDLIDQYSNNQYAKLDDTDNNALKIKALELKLEYLNPSSKNKFNRKLKKLKRTPILFIKDMIKKRSPI